LPEFTEEDARRMFDRGTTAIITLDNVGNVTSDPYAMCRPGYRFSDRAPSETAYQDMCRDLSDAWKPPEQRDAPLQGIWPLNGIPADLTHMREGDPCTRDGAKGRLVRRGEYLYCETEPPQPTRADSLPPAPPRFMDAAQAQAIRDAAYEEYCSYIRDAWKP
jgi:hypothetical protein